MQFVFDTPSHGVGSGLVAVHHTWSGRLGLLRQSSSWVASAWAEADSSCTISACTSTSRPWIRTLRAPPSQGGAPCAGRLVAVRMTMLRWLPVVEARWWSTRPSVKPCRSQERMTMGPWRAARALDSSVLWIMVAAWVMACTSLLLSRCSPGCCSDAWYEPPWGCPETPAARGAGCLWP